MTLSPERDPVPELTTTRIGGRSARLIAFVVVVLLAGVVYIGASGRSQSALPRDHQPSSPVAVVTPSPPASNAPLTEVQSVRADPTAPVRYQYLGTGLLIGGTETLAVLDEVAPRLFRGLYRIPYSLVTPMAHLEFDAVTASVSHDELEPLGNWTFPLNSVHPGGGPDVVLVDAHEAPNGTRTLSDPEFASLATNGYNLRITSSNLPDGGLMTVEVTVNPDLAVADEKYAIAAGPSGALLRFALDPGGNSFSGQGRIPAELLGRLIPVTLTAQPDPKVNPATVSTWWIRIASRPKDDGNLARIVAHNVGRPVAQGEPHIIASGYDIRITQAVVKGHLELRVILSVPPTTGDLPPSPSPPRSASDPAATELLAVELAIGGALLAPNYDERGVDHLHASYRVSLPAPQPVGTFDLVGATTGLQYGKWSIALGVFHGNVGTDSVIGAFAPTVLASTQRAPDRAAGPSASAIERNGYRVTVTGARQDGFEIIDIVVDAAVTTTYPSENYEVVARAGGRKFSADTVESLPGHMRGEIRFLGSLRAARATVELSALPSAAPPSGRIVVARQVVDLPRAQDFLQPITPTVVSGTPTDGSRGLPAIERDGYTLTLLVTYDGRYRVVFWDLQLNPDSPAPEPSVSRSRATAA